MNLTKCRQNSEYCFLSIRITLMRGHLRWDETSVPWDHLDDDGMTDAEDDSEDDDDDDDDS